MNDTLVERVFFSFSLLVCGTVVVLPRQFFGTLVKLSSRKLSDVNPKTIEIVRLLAAFVAGGLCMMIGENPLLK